MFAWFDLFCSLCSLRCVSSPGDALAREKSLEGRSLQAGGGGN